MEFNIRLSNKQVLRGIIQSPGENSRAVIILVHGIGEHIQRYSFLADYFKNERIGLAGLDLPGHGRSDGRRGMISSFAQIDEMIDILLDTCRKTFPGIPIFIYGHSLGGTVVLNYVLHRNPKIKGVIVTSPWLRLSFEPSKSKLILAGLMKNLLPGLTQPSGLNISHLSHDKKVVEEYRTDPLVHGLISLSLFHSTMTAAKYSLVHAPELKIPALMLHGSDDLITSPEGSRIFAEQTGLAELKIWEGGYHELHNELFREEVLNFILNWINRQLNN
jgi:alpha-beta hydrolase superfamily lysophospholipase